MHYSEPNMHISIPNSALWDLEQVGCKIYEIGLFQSQGFQF